jgi:hypothetical protein
LEGRERERGSGQEIETRSSIVGVQPCASEYAKRRDGREEREAEAERGRERGRDRGRVVEVEREREEEGPGREREGFQGLLPVLFCNGFAAGEKTDRSPT